MLGGVEEDIKVEDGHAALTNPAEAEDFVKKTGCDSLACAIGTSHGAYKFKGRQSLHFDVLKKIQALLPNYPLVMHGSSSVPKDEVAASTPPAARCRTPWASTRRNTCRPRNWASPR